MEHYQGVSATDINYDVIHSITVSVTTMSLPFPDFDEGIDHYPTGAVVAGFSPSTLPFCSVMLKATCLSSLKFSVLKLPCSSLICHTQEKELL